MKTEAKFQIAVLDRGFVYVGTCAVADGVLTIVGARCVRRWGTSAGLGELAMKGPQARTVLDDAGRIVAPASALIHLIDCDLASWAVPATAA